LATITTVIGGLKDAGFLAQNPLANGEAIEPDPDVDCGTFQLGARRVRIHSNLADIGSEVLAKRGWMRQHKKICLPPNWGMRAGAFVATIQARLSEHKVAPYFDALSGLPETPGRRRDMRF
jgi:hypothetical protein